MKTLPVNELDLSAIAQVQTDRVRIVSTDFTTEKGLLTGATFKVKVNVYSVPTNSKQYGRYAPEYRIRLSLADGSLTAHFSDRNIQFPLAGKTKLEFDALGEFCAKLREVVGIDRDHVAAIDQPPANELADVQRELRELRDENQKLSWQNKQLTEDLNKVKEKVRDFIED